MSNNTNIMPEDYQDFVYRLTYYLLGKVAHLVPRSISPNSITLAAFVSSILGCLLLLFVQSPVAYLYWAIFNFLWYILDALDGIHARLTKQSSEFGAFLDHFLDSIFFVVMFAVFTVKFDLLHPLYIFIILLRAAAVTSVFLVQVSTNRLLLPKFSGGLELLLMTTVMLLSYFYPHFDPAQYVTQATLLNLFHVFAFHIGFFMKMSLFVYLIGVPINFILQLKFVHKHHMQAR